MLIGNVRINRVIILWPFSAIATALNNNYCAIFKKKIVAKKFLHSPKTTKITHKIFSTHIVSNSMQIKSSYMTKNFSTKILHANISQHKNFPNYGNYK